jgi:hypothetical protein
VDSDFFPDLALICNDAISQYWCSPERQLIPNRVGSGGGVATNSI